MNKISNHRQMIIKRIMMKMRAMKLIPMIKMKKMKLKMINKFKFHRSRLFLKNKTIQKMLRLIKILKIK